jgi:hypothetical protein
LNQFRYTPAAVVLATGGTSALVANTAYIVISQLSECTYILSFVATILPSLRLFA